MIMRPPPSPKSMRRLLVREIAGLFTIVWLVASSFILYRTWVELQESYTHQVSHLAQVVATIFEDEKPLPASATQLVTARPGQNYFIVVEAAGKVLMRTSNAPADLNEPEGWHIERARSKDGIEVVAGLQREEVRDLVISVGLGAAAPMLIGLMLTLFLMWRAVGRGLRPLVRLRDDVAARSADALEPIETNDMPEELLPLARGLNDLLTRLGNALASEKRFVADASHELRTPLTAIRAQVETIDRDRLAPATNAALERVLRGVDRATRLVNQLLALARADAGSLAPAIHLALDELLASIASDLFPRAVRLGKDLDLLLEPAQTMGSQEDFEMLVGNLLENAIHHATSTVRLSCHAINGLVVIDVEDDGKGVPAAERQIIFERFRRGSNRADQSAAIPGAGLGLSIVASIAQRTGARINVTESTMGGLHVSVSFHGDRR